MDVRVRHKKTDKEKTLPLKVYQALKSAYVLLEEVPGVENQPEPVKKKGEVVEHVVDDPTVTNAELDHFHNVEEYQMLSGKKPDGRWSPEKLKEKIQELKTRTNEG